MRVLAGTSGFSYPDWKGGLYPSDAKDGDFLRLYAARLPAVELNSTFHRMPRGSVVESWQAQVPSGFRFALKASRRITHQQKLRDTADTVGYLFRAVSHLSDPAVLFQLPPFLQRDLPLLEDFLATLPAGAKAALEVRHRSWLDDGVYDLLRARGVALVATDERADGLAVPLIATASFGYLRLRAADYSDEGLDAWAERIAALPGGDALVFFKHEARGPEFALRLMERAASLPRLARTRAREDLTEWSPERSAGSRARR